MTLSSEGLGAGLGLRPVHYSHILENRPRVGWFEAISENYLGLDAHSGGRPLRILESIRADYPVVLHGVSLSIGSTDPLDTAYLARLKALADRIDPAWVSDHVCWTGIGGENLHDLLPLPYTEAVLRHLVERVDRTQNVLGRRLTLENVSSYLGYAHSEMTEWEFLAELARRADCDLLLDVNNVYVSAHNHGFDAREFLRAIPAARVRQMHLAGHSVKDGYLLDTHDAPVPEAVWELYREAVALYGAVPTLIERDDNIPTFAELEHEVARADGILRAARTRGNAAGATP